MPIPGPLPSGARRIATISVSSSRPRTRRRWPILRTGATVKLTCARVCGDCLKLRRLRDQRTRKVQTLFGTINVDAARISACRCRSDSGFADVSWSPLTEWLPDRCTPELGRLQAELGARHSYREAARLLGRFCLVGRSIKRPCAIERNGPLPISRPRRRQDLSRLRSLARDNDGDRRSPHSSRSWLSIATHRRHRWQD